MPRTVSSSTSSARALFSRYVVALVVSFALLAGVFVAIDVTRANILSRSRSIDGLKTQVVAPDAPANFVIVGSDSRSFVSDAADAQAFGAKDTSARSDTLMVVHLDPRSRRAYVVSFPRDLWVEIPGRGKAKLNSAYNDGPQAVIDTLEQDFGIPVNHYLDVDFATFRDAVNAIGSVKVYFPAPTRDRYSGLTIPDAGCVPLNGDQALAYVRSRYYEQLGRDGVWHRDPLSDISRIGRQQAFLRKLAGAAVADTSANPLDVLDLASSVMSNVRRDPQLTDEQLLGFVSAFADINPYDTNAIEMVTYPWTSGPDQDGQSVLYPDNGKGAAVLARLRDAAGSASRAASDVAPSSVSLRVLNGSGADGAARTALAALRTAGFVGSGAANADRVDHTEIRYRKGSIDKAHLVNSYLAGVGTLIEDPTLQNVDVLVTLGPDFTAVTAPGADTAAGSPATPATPATAAGPNPNAPTMEAC